MVLVLCGVGVGFVWFGVVLVLVWCGLCVGVVCVCVGVVCVGVGFVWCRCGLVLASVGEQSCKVGTLSCCCSATGLHQKLPQRSTPRAVSVQGSGFTDNFP